ncbi:MAG: type I-E CRISPR-associated protein Cse1/CasA [Hyphomicrobiaceae bacterium]
MNLLLDRWIPVRLRDGSRGVIAVSEIVRPDVIALDFPRLDFNGAVTEFLIAVLSTTFPPADDKEWRKLWRHRPSHEELQAAFEPVLAAFEAGVFAQWTATPGDDEKPEERTVDRLLIDNLSGSTAEGGRDILNRAGRIQTLGLPSALAALITLQMHANQGGRGAYQCQRGGGALTTLVRYGTDLWGLVWPNVETIVQIRTRAVGAIPGDPLAPFPWMWKPGADLGPDNKHPCAIYWTMPRRIKLEISKSNEATCSLSGEPATEVVCKFSYVSGGPRFEGWTGHPMSAIVHKKKEGEVVTSTVVTPIERVGMQHWLGLVQDGDPDVAPAPCVAHAREHRREPSARLVVHGYAVKAATVLAWQSAEMPLVLAEASEVDAELRETARMLVTATEKAAAATKKAVKTALGSAAAKDSRKKYINGLSDQAYGRVWRDAESAFFATLSAVPNRMSDQSDDPARVLRQTFHNQLLKAARAIVTDLCPDDGLVPRDVIRAHLELHRTLHSRAMLTTLLLPVAP